MKGRVKEIIQYAAAVFLLVSGVLLCYLSFFTCPIGVVSDSVLWYLGQCLMFAGSVFGITSYVNYQIEKKLHGTQEKQKTD